MLKWPRSFALVFACAGSLALSGCQESPVDPGDGGSSTPPAHARKGEFVSSSVASAINAQGQVVGWSGDFDFVAFLWTPKRANGTSGSMVSLGTLGGNRSEAWSINTSGQVVGNSATSGDAVTHAFLWKPKRANGPTGSMLDLGTLGGSVSGATDINTRGQIVGYSLVSGDANYHAFLWTPTTANGTTGSIVDLGTLNGVDAQATAINTQGQVVGTSGGHIFLWTPATANGTTGTMTDLGFGTPYSINTQGQVVGSDGIAHAFLWTPTTANGTTGSMVDLGTFGGTVSRATRINAQGQVAGFGYVAGNSHSRPFLWTPTTANGTTGSMIDLGTFGGRAGVAYGINTQGQVVGWSYYAGGDEANTGGHAFVWKPTEPNGTTGTMTDIGTLPR